MKSALFHFKQFSIRQQDSAMKIGTDGVLLGAWAILLTEDCFVLDIGPGTGLIALMLAQRYPNAIIDAVELNEAAALEAKFNFKNSPWSNRLNAIHASVQDYALNTPKKYDHIVCNPPFYQGAYPIDNNARDSARNNASLLFSVLFASINSLLKVTGICSLIEAQKNDLFLLHSTKVKGNDDAPFKRVLLSFSREQNVPTENDLCLELSRNIRTLAHQELVKDFYLAKP
jgi:tRNA1Val (adenine37-N6)-methyltransferase